MEEREALSEQRAEFDWTSEKTFFIVSYCLSYDRDLYKKKKVGLEELSL